MILECHFPIVNIYIIMLFSFVERISTERFFFTLTIHSLVAGERSFKRLILNILFLIIKYLLTCSVIYFFWSIALWILNILFYAVGRYKLALRTIG